MSTAPFVIERTYDAPTSIIWKAITNKEEMKRWYFDISPFKPEPGFEFQFVGEDAQGVKYVHLCKVIEVVFEKKLSYSWRYEGFTGISIVMIELFDEGEKTRLKLTHEGLESFPADNPAFNKQNFADGWTYIIGKSLKEFVEQSNHH